jgi:hypothetical protein
MGAGRIEVANLFWRAGRYRGMERAAKFWKKN